VNLLNADAAARLNTVGRIVKVPLGVKDIGFGVVQRILMMRVIITTTTMESEGMVLGRLGTAGHLQ
jgi:hypothetical protein